MNKLRTTIGRSGGIQNINRNLKGFVYLILEETKVFTQYDLIDREDGPYVLFPNFHTNYRVSNMWWLEEKEMYDVEYIPRNKWTEMGTSKHRVITMTPKFIILKGDRLYL